MNEPLKTVKPSIKDGKLTIEAQIPIGHFIKNKGIDGIATLTKKVPEKWTKSKEEWNETYQMLMDELNNIITEIESKYKDSGLKEVKLGRSYITLLFEV